MEIVNNSHSPKETTFLSSMRKTIFSTLHLPMIAESLNALYAVMPVIAIAITK